MKDKNLEREISEYDPDKDIQETGGLYGMRLADRMLANQENNPCPQNRLEIFAQYCEENGINISTVSSDHTEPGILLKGLRQSGYKMNESYSPNQVRRIAERYLERYQNQQS